MPRSMIPLALIQRENRFTNQTEFENETGKRRVRKYGHIKNVGNIEKKLTK